MLFDRLKEAKKNLGLEEKLLNDPDGAINEEVVIGQDYCEPEMPIRTSDDPSVLGFEDPHKDYKVWNNGLEGDEDVVISEDLEELVDKEFNESSAYSTSIGNTNSLISEIKGFYEHHPEFEGRLYPNGQLNPALSMENYRLDKAWLCNNLSLDDYNKFDAQDSLFKQSYKDKLKEWDEESKKHMTNIAAILASESLEDYNKNVDTFNAVREEIINEGNLELNPHFKESLKKITEEELKKKIQEIDFNPVEIEKKEESMDRIQEFERKTKSSYEDTSGNTKSNVDFFLEKYVDGNDIIQVLRKDLMSILSDVQWIIESGNQNEQFALDFADALNELSVRV